MFICNKCGECCRHVNLNTIYGKLDRGDDVCKYLRGNLCSIYETRPLMCRIDMCYELFFKDLMSKNEYYEFNYKACDKLKSMMK